MDEATKALLFWRYLMEEIYGLEGAFADLSLVLSCQLDEE